MGLLEALHQEREELESKLKKVAAMIEDYGGTVGKTAGKKRARPERRSEEGFERRCEKEMGKGES